MPVSEDARYRLRVAEGFLEEAHQDMALQRWRACVDNSQLATENAAKAVLALSGPLGALIPACCFTSLWNRVIFPRLSPLKSKFWWNMPSC